MTHDITTQRALRAAFWEAHPGLSRRRVRSYDGKGLMFPTDTRVAWVDFIDHMARDGRITYELAQRAVLSPDD